MKQKLLTGFMIFIFFSKTAMAQNVGIGIDSPTSKLHVNGDLKLQFGLPINNISNDDRLNPGADNILPTQAAVKNYVLNKSWLLTNIDTVAPFPFSPLVVGSAVAVVTQGNYAYVLSSGRLSIIDVTDPGKMVAKGFINAPTLKSLAVKGNYAYVVSGTTAATSLLSIYDISDPNTIVAKATTSANLDRPIKVQVQGRYAYVISLTNTSLCIFDINNPANIIARGVTTANITSSTSLFVKGNYAYVTSSLAQGALSIYDVSDADNITPKAISNNTASLSRPVDVFVNNNYAYLVTDANRLTIADVSDPDQIIVKGTIITTLLRTVAISVQGNVAYVVSRDDDKLSIFDVTDPAAIVAKGVTSANLDMPNAVFVNGNFIYVTSANNSGKLCSFNYSATANVLVAPNGSLSAAASPWQVQGSNVYRTGNVGIGITNPLLPLEVGISAPFNTGSSYGYLNASGAVGSQSAASLPVSIKASGIIMAPSFAAISDQRIKRNIISSPSQNDLNTLLKIRVTDYQFKDSVYNGNGIIKGVIAQELEKILPQAVHTNGDYIPDIYCLSTVTQYNEKDHTLKISLCKPHQLKAGDKVKTYSGDGMQEQYVAVINDATTFTLSNWQIKQAGMNPLQKVFVWGKWVEDFHTVDYNQVFALGISAIQQLAKENEALKDELKNKTVSLQQQIDALKQLIKK
jgi:hypothetical protein